MTCRAVSPGGSTHTIDPVRDTAPPTSISASYSQYAALTRVGVRLSSPASCPLPAHLLPFQNFSPSFPDVELFFPAADNSRSRLPLLLLRPQPIPSFPPSCVQGDACVDTNGGSSLDWTVYRCSVTQCLYLRQSCDKTHRAACDILHTSPMFCYSFTSYWDFTFYFIYICLIFFIYLYYYFEYLILCFAFLVCFYLLFFH